MTIPKPVNVQFCTGSRYFILMQCQLYFPHLTALTECKIQDIGHGVLTGSTVGSITDLSPPQHTLMYVLMS